MTEAVVIDTNVCLVANGRHEEASIRCVKACVDALTACRGQVVVIDELYLILGEDQKHLSFAGQPGLGDAFFKWLWDNHCNEEHCHRVAITPTSNAKRCFEEFPQDPALDSFDPSDQKFVAVALASGLLPPVLNAADSDWWNARTTLAAHGVTVSFVCPDRMPSAAGILVPNTRKRPAGSSAAVRGGGR